MVEKEALKKISEICGHAGFNVGGPVEHCEDLNQVAKEELIAKLLEACSYIKDISSIAYYALKKPPVN